MSEQKQCKQCEKLFPPKTKNQIFCTPNCNKTANRELMRGRNGYTKLSTGTVGALAEIMVCADLMRMGYEVFRAMSPSSDADIVATKGGEFIKIEVRSAFYSRTEERIYCSRLKTDGKKLVGVTHFDNKIHYIDWEP